ncbi:hypothetical protein G6L33_01060 [Agrobacterium rhizogenes]|nr:hypothetical protein [Rhizobium rhizogenes]NTG25744.1 hypothetical protein [Rhizobium rhizogenes]NTH62432.1 hypothetical protein [Rhizobium rhizogenes]
MTVAKSLTDRIGEAAPYIEISDEIDRAVATLRVVWLALMSKEWLDNEHLDHCADCLERATNDLSGARATAAKKAAEIHEKALSTPFE